MANSQTANVKTQTLNPSRQGGPEYSSKPPKWQPDCPDIAQDSPQMDKCSPKDLPMYPQDGINVAPNTHPKANDTQHTSHIAGPAECAVAIE